MIPLEAKGGRIGRGIVQIEQDFAMRALNSTLAVMTAIVYGLPFVESNNPT